MASEKIPLTRLRAVEYALKKETNLHVKTAIRTWSQNSKTVDFPEYVWEVAEAMIAANIDPCEAGKPKTIAFAQEFYKVGATSTKKSAKAAEKTAPAPVEVSTEKPTAEAGEPTSLSVNVPIRVAIYTLLIAAYELSHSHDRKAGHAELREKIKVATDDCLKGINSTVGAIVAPLNSPAEVEPAAEVPAPEPIQEAAVAEPAPVAAAIPLPVVPPTPPAPPKIPNAA